MPEYFLKGWFEAFPGVDKHVLRLPDDAADADIEVALQEGQDGSHITFNATFSPGTDADDGNMNSPHVVIQYDNRGEDLVSVDYLITPRRIVIPRGTAASPPYSPTQLA